MRSGDFALIPEIVMTGKRGGSSLEKTNDVLVTIRMHLFAGELRASPVYETQQVITTKLHTPFA